MNEKLEQTQTQSLGEENKLKWTTVGKREALRGMRGQMGETTDKTRAATGATRRAYLSTLIR